MNKGKKNIILKDVPEELHYQFNIMCRQQRKTMKGKIVELMGTSIREHKKQEKDE
jgi:dihydropteroate synthase